MSADTPTGQPAPNFEGRTGRTCGEHRTVGPHRAWCFDCSEWCYPDEPCHGCDPRIYTQAQLDEAFAAGRAAQLADDIALAEQHDVLYASGEPCGEPYCKDPGRCPARQLKRTPFANLLREAGRE